MYIEQSFQTPPPNSTDIAPSSVGEHEQPHYPFTRRQKMVMRANGLLFTAGGIRTIIDGDPTSGSLLVGYGLASIGLSVSGGEWSSADAAGVFDAFTFDERDEFGQPLDNRGEIC
ncbi:MAG TPA: hypothetical protein VHA05_02760 [Candidatus Saccharimonadales bacterium]|nr:hypothetical protein [Candidatus Saccharimonadales bacterium]